MQDMHAVLVQEADSRNMKVMVGEYVAYEIEMK